MKLKLNCVINVLCSHCLVLRKSEWPFQHQFRYMCVKKLGSKQVFQNKINSFLRSNSRYENSVVTEFTLNGSVVLCRTELPRLPKNLNETGFQKHEEASSDLISKLLHFVSDSGNTRKPSILKEIDRQCCDNLPLMTTAEVLKLIDAWIHVLKHDVIKISFYNKAVKKMGQLLDSCSLNVANILQYMFYVALLKKSNHTKDIISKCLVILNENIDYLKSMALEEVCILANATYTTGTKISSHKVLDILSGTLLRNMDYLIKEPELLIAIIKSLRQAQYINFNVCSALSSSLQNSEVVGSFDLATKVHLLLFFTNGQFAKSDVPIVDSLIKQCICNLNDDLNPASSKLHVRPKDIAILLWSVSNFDAELEPKVIDDVLVPQIMKQVKAGKYQNNFDMFISSLLSLCMIAEFQADELFIKCVSDVEVRKLKEKNKVRPLSRLALILTCMAVEAPHLMKEGHKKWKSYLDVTLPKPQVGVQLQQREYLRDIYRTLKYFAPRYECGFVKCEFNIPHIHIAGITLEVLSKQTRYPVSVEVLDQTVCFRGTDIPNGLMKLKLRLLRNSKSRVVEVSRLELQRIDTKSKDALSRFLEDKLRKVTES